MNDRILHLGRAYTFLTFVTGEAVYHIGQDTPTLSQFQDDFQLPEETLNSTYASFQLMAVETVIRILLEPDSETYLRSLPPTYSCLMPLIQPLKERDIETLLSLVYFLTSGPPWSFEENAVVYAFARRCDVEVERSRGNQPTPHNETDGLEDDLTETLADSETGGNTREPGQG